MEKNYTPGPWGVWESDDHEDFIKEFHLNGRDSVEVATGVQCICLMNNNKEKLNAIPNARLIAAAPALVEALEEAKRFIENGIEYGFIIMPDRNLADAAHDTMPTIVSALKLALEEK